jgi:group I intron endonuclease
MVIFNLNNRTGIYQILNLTNSKRYIGSAALDFIKRWNIHKHHLRYNTHPNIHLQRAWNLNQESNFSFQILEECQPDRCIEREQFYIDILQPEYNICPIAGSPLGRLATEVARRRISESKRGEKHPNYGKHLSEETKRKIGTPQIGPLNHRFGKPPWNKGKTGFITTEETRQKRSLAMKGRIPWNKGKTYKQKPRISPV